MIKHDYKLIFPSSVYANFFLVIIELFIAYIIFFKELIFKDLKINFELYERSILHQTYLIILQKLNATIIPNPFILTYFMLPSILSVLYFSFSLSLIHSCIVHTFTLILSRKVLIDYLIYFLHINNISSRIQNTAGKDEGSVFYSLVLTETLAKNCG